MKKLSVGVRVKVINQYTAFYDRVGTVFGYREGAMLPWDVKVDDHILDNIPFGANELEVIGCPCGIKTCIANHEPKP